MTFCFMLKLPPLTVPTLLTHDGVVLVTFLAEMAVWTIHCTWRRNGGEAAVLICYIVFMPMDKEGIVHIRIYVIKLSQPNGGG